VIADAVGAILLAAITLYAVLGGADFGGGFWDLVAGGDLRGRTPRRWIETSITPVWEANHVWLVFSLVIFWTAFPSAFADVMTTAALPLWLVVFGIVLRGSGFALRKEVYSPRLLRSFGAAFAFSSLIVPFFMGTVIGGIATGEIHPGATHAASASWTSTTSLLLGALFVGACAYLAAVYLVSEGARHADQLMVAYFTLRAKFAGVATGVVSLVTLFELHTSSPRLFHGLTGRAMPFVLAAAVSGAAVLALLSMRHFMGLRYIAGLGVVAVVWGWGVAQYPVLLPGSELTLHNTGTPVATLVSIVVLCVIVAVVILPSFGLLFHLQGRRALLDGDAQQHLADLQPEELDPNDAARAIRAMVIERTEADVSLAVPKRCLE
jgi:cytochrome d ubiquinol oxidase subunit II